MHMYMYICWKLLCNIVYLHTLLTVFIVNHKYYDHLTHASKAQMVVYKPLQSSYTLPELCDLLCACMRFIHDCLGFATTL